MTAVLVAAFALGGPARAEAQTIDWQAQRADAGYVADVGMGLTIAGLAITAGATGLFFGTSDAVGFAAIISGGFFWSLGGLLALAGIPTWIVGGVRASIADAGDARSAVARDWEIAGTTVFFSALALAVAGTALLAGSVALNDTDGGLAGVIMLPIGVFVAAFIGAPMWAEGARF